LAPQIARLRSSGSTAMTRAFGKTFREICRAEPDVGSEIQDERGCLQIPQAGVSLCDEDLIEDRMSLLPRRGLPVASP
jgi:hypothetical protein